MEFKAFSGKTLLVLLMTSAIAACSEHRPAPVYDLYSRSTAKALTVNNSNGVYTVKPGDTLFSIAWIHSVDHERLSHINKISNNRIYPGQKLRLADDIQAVIFDEESLVAAVYSEVLNKPVLQAPTKPKSNWRSKSVKRKTASPVRVAKASNQNIKISKAVQTKRYSKPRSRHSRSNNVKRSFNNLNWIWPTEGPVIEKFSASSNSNRGLDIAGKRGQPVRATAPGKVVYKGNGLRGYGNLVIIKHNDDYLSAYAHNNKVHVAENEFVKAGQRIADIGSSGAQRDKLHFEIRYKGKPVDPMNYLPQK